VRSGQQPLIQQLGQFRAACLDTVRRLGLVAHEARPGDEFDPRYHQTPDGKDPAPGAKIAGTIAAGYSYQSQPVRRILVAIQKDEPTAPAPTGSESAPEPAAESSSALELPLAPEQGS
jgi:molecular chaperone GrpE (heat shock protein)